MCSVFYSLTWISFENIQCFNCNLNCSCACVCVWWNQNACAYVSTFASLRITTLFLSPSQTLSVRWKNGRVHKLLLSVINVVLNCNEMKLIEGYSLNSTEARWTQCARHWKSFSWENCVGQNAMTMDTSGAIVVNASTHTHTHGKRQTAI